MKKFKFLVAIFAAMLSHSAFAEGCKFYWHHYGDNEIHAELNQSIGSEVTNNFCRFANQYEIVLVTDAFTLGQGCAGYAAAGLRKKNSDKMITSRRSSLNHDTACRGSNDAKKLAIESAHRAVKRVMFDLENQIEEAKKLN